MKKRLVKPAAIQEKADNQILIDAMLAELERANPAWRASLPQRQKNVLDRRRGR